MAEKIYDLIIIGGGPAGLTAGIYASRRKLSNLIITKDIGGQAATIPHIENYPGYDDIDGFGLTDKMKNQAAKFGAEFAYEEAEKISKEADIFKVQTTTNNFYFSKTIILSFGVTPRNLDVPGEKEFTGKGVTYCANCDGPLYKNKIVAVVGGGNSALDAAEYLSKIASKVYLIHRRAEFRGDEVLMDKVKKAANIELILEAVVTKINGEKFVKNIEIEDLKSKTSKSVEVDGVFIEVGHIVNSTPIKEVVAIDSQNQIIIDISGATSQAGIFAAGDVTNSLYKQIIIACGAGAKAALSAYKFLQEKSGQTMPANDWSH